MKTRSRSSGARGDQGGAGAKFLVFLVALAAVFSLAWMLLLPGIVSSVIQKQIGCAATIGSLYANPFTASVDLRNLKVDNPDGFPRPDFLVVNQFKAAVAPGSVFADRLVVKEAVFDVAGVTLVKNSAGATNAGLIEARFLGPPQKKPAAASAERPRRFLIQTLTVKLGKIVIADYSRGGEPQVRTLNVNLDRTFTNVTDLKQISAPLLADLTAAGAAGFAGDVLGLVIPAPILERLGVVTKGAGGLLQDTGGKTLQTVRGLLDSLEQSPEK